MNLFINYSVPLTQQTFNLQQIQPFKVSKLFFMGVDAWKIVVYVYVWFLTIWKEFKNYKDTERV